MANILILNGPNLNLLGTREPDIYGNETLERIEQRLSDMLEGTGHRLLFFQSNAEHELVDQVQQASGQGVVYIVLNPAAYTHTSVALRDAILGCEIPFIEVHLSNVNSRESFRQRSYFSDIAQGVISGFGAQGYELALQAALRQIEN